MSVIISFIGVVKIRKHIASLKIVNNNNIRYSKLTLNFFLVVMQMQGRGLPVIRETGLAVPEQHVFAQGYSPRLSQTP